MKKLFSILFSIILVLAANSMVQMVCGETDQLDTRETQDYGIRETGTVPISGILTAGDPSDGYGTWGGGVTFIITQIYWTPSGEGLYIGVYDVTHTYLWSAGPFYGGYAYKPFRVPEGHQNCQWQVYIWGADLTGRTQYNITAIYILSGIRKSGC